VGGIAPRDKTYEEALKEMMERIKSGQALKPTTTEAINVYLLKYSTDEYTVWDWQ